MEKALALLAPLVVYGYVFLLHILLPARSVQGYVTKPGSPEKLRYRLNGIWVLIAVLLTWAGVCYAGLMPWDWFFTHRWYALAGAVVFGLIFSVAVVLPYPPTGKSFLADFYLGRADNIQWLGERVDAKMWLYLAGAVMLEVNVLSFAAHHHLAYGPDASAGIFLCAGLFTFFVFDYLTFEEVHLYTYDLFAEKVGFKLGWGCLAFYPFFYAVPLWSTAAWPDPGIPTWMLVLSGAVFLLSWSLSRGANLQKYHFKRDPSRAFLGMTPKTLTDGKHTLLAGGYWGVSRHINYLGEIGMAVGIVLSTGYALTPWPWLYPLYYVALLLPRQVDDDKRCALKYGDLWKDYVKKVPYRIIPYIY